MASQRTQGSRGCGGVSPQARRLSATGGAQAACSILSYGSSTRLPGRSVQQQVALQIVADRRPHRDGVPSRGGESLQAKDMPGAEAVQLIDAIHSHEAAEVPLGLGETQPSWESFTQSALVLGFTDQPAIASLKSFDCHKFCALQHPNTAHIKAVNSVRVSIVSGQG